MAKMGLLKRVLLSLAEGLKEDRRRMAQNEARMAQNEELLVEWKQEHRAEMTGIRAEVAGIREEAAEQKKLTTIHSKAILKLLRK